MPEDVVDKKQAVAPSSAFGRCSPAGGRLTAAPCKSNFLHVPIRISTRWACAAVPLLAIAFAFTATAAADYYAVGPPEAGWKPDNSNHTYCFGQEYTGNNMKDAAHAKMAGLQNQTTMTKEFRSCDSGIDARFALANLPGSVIGQYTCPDRSGSYCLHAVLEYDSAAIVGYNKWLNVTCHEIGHSVGLFHGTSDCMTSGTETSYGNHHQTHINNDRF